MEIKYRSYSEAVIDNGWTSEEYYKQFDPIDLVEGETYASNVGNWMQTEYLIIFVGEGVAVGKEVGKTYRDADNASFELFSACGMMGGWRKNDQRPEYKLQEL